MIPYQNEISAALVSLIWVMGLIPLIVLLHERETNMETVTENNEVKNYSVTLHLDPSEYERLIVQSFLLLGGNQILPDGSLSQKLTTHLLDGLELQNGDRRED